jgi:hypothetical protein
MSELIKQLIKQADLDDDMFPIEEGWENPELKRFAELIVQECISILMTPEYAMNHPEELNTYNRAWVNGRRLGVDQIKEAFDLK